MSDFRHYLDEQIKRAKRNYRELCNAWSVHRDPMPDARHLEALGKASGLGPLVKGDIIGVDVTETLRQQLKFSHLQYLKARQLLELYLISQRVDRAKREYRINRRKARKNPPFPITASNFEYRDGV